MRFTQPHYPPISRIVCCALVLLFSGPLLATSVTIKTSLGDVEIELFDEQAPQSVANFLNYVNAGDYNSSFIHRSEPGFVIQGGGFRYIEGLIINISANPPVVNEPGISNLRGTLAMAKLSGDPDSATNQWFINLADNSENLDDQNGGFTVFGEVSGNGMEVVDAISALPIWNAGGSFTRLPLRDYSGVDFVTDEHLVMIDVSENSSFRINPGLNDAWFNSDTNGQGFFIMIYPASELMFLAWFTYDSSRPDQSVPAILGEPAHRWLTAQGNYADNKAVLDINISEGGIFDAASPAPTSRQDGTMIVEFSNCNEGTITYDIPSIGRQGVVAIERVAQDNIARCEQLAED
jgi:peptidyl-prolyl cis-trans isomerase A (cyclophilin A)